MRHLYLALLLATASMVSAQTFSGLNSKKSDNLYEEYTFNVFLRYTNVSDPYSQTIQGLTANMSFRTGSLEKGGTGINYENPTLGDFVYVLSHWKKSQEQSKTVDKSFGSGFFGWFQMYFNAVVRDRFILAPGFSAGDYIFGINQMQKPTSPHIMEPNGYYFHLGPAIKASYLLTDNMWIEGFAHNDIGFKASNPGGEYQNIKGYKKPFFFNVGANLYSTSRFFGGFRVVKLIDRGENDIKATRLDISAGYMF